MIPFKEYSCLNLLIKENNTKILLFPFMYNNPYFFIKSLLFFVLSFKLAIFIYFLLHWFWHNRNRWFLLIFFHPFFFIEILRIFCSVMCFLKLRCFISLPSFKLCGFLLHFRMSICDILPTNFDISLSKFACIQNPFEKSSISDIVLLHILHLNLLKFSRDLIHKCINLHRCWLSSLMRILNNFTEELLIQQSFHIFPVENMSTWSINFLHCVPNQVQHILQNLREF